MGGTKTSKFYDFWIFDSRGTLIYGFEYTKLLQQKKDKVWEHVSNILFVSNLDMTETWKNISLEKTGTNNDEDPRNKIL